MTDIVNERMFPAECLDQHQLDGSKVQIVLRHKGKIMDYVSTDYLRGFPVLHFEELPKGEYTVEVTHQWA
jgi:hypothetical protein